MLQRVAPSPACSSMLISSPHWTRSNCAPVSPGTASNAPRVGSNAHRNAIDVALLWEEDVFCEASVSGRMRDVCDGAIVDVDESAQRHTTRWPSVHAAASSCAEGSSATLRTDRFSHPPNDFCGAEALCVSIKRTEPSLSVSPDKREIEREKNKRMGVEVRYTCSVSRGEKVHGSNEAHSKAEQNRAEQSRAEQNRTEQSTECREKREWSLGGA